jgi:hypothetical protein
MLFRQLGDGILAISQPTHAAVSGQLAMTWGSQDFGALEPAAEVILGATLHDIGWLHWERVPTLNPETGLPRTFLQIPTRTHLDIWGPASRLALPFGRYVALLVSMHGTALYGFHDYTRDTDEEARDARAFVEQEERFQRDIIAQLRGDSIPAEWVSDEQIRRNQRLVATWDGMSLAICGGLNAPRTLRDVPAVEGVRDIVLTPHGDSVVVDPWPFAEECVTTRFEGRILAGTFTTDENLRTALQVAPWKTVTVTLQP